MAGQFDFKLDTSAFTESAEAAKNLAKTLEDAIAKADKAINNLYDGWAGKGRNEFEKNIKFLNNRLQISKMAFGICMRISLLPKKDTYKPIPMQPRQWMVYQRAVYPLVIIK